MLYYQRLLGKFFTSCITVLASIIAAEAAMSNPILIDPSNQSQESDYNLKMGGVMFMIFALTTRLLDIS